MTAGLEEIAAAGSAAIVDVDRGRHATREIPIGDEAFGAEEPVFFAVGDEEDDSIAKMLVTDGARDFDERRDSYAVIGRPCACADGIVMRAEHENAGARIAGNSSHDIGNRRAGRVGVACECLLQGDRISKLAKLRHHTIPNDVVIRRTDRMRRSIAENGTEDGDRAR